MTVEIEMTDADFKSISNYASENKISVAEFLLKSAIEKIGYETISDEDLLKVANETIKERAEVYRVLAQ